MMMQTPSTLASSESASYLDHTGDRRITLSPPKSNELSIQERIKQARKAIDDATREASFRVGSTVTSDNNRNTGDYGRKQQEQPMAEQAGGDIIQSMWEEENEHDDEYDANKTSLDIGLALFGDELSDGGGSPVEAWLGEIEEELEDITISLAGNGDDAIGGTGRTYEPDLVKSGVNVVGGVDGENDPYADNVVNSEHQKNNGNDDEKKVDEEEVERLQDQITFLQKCHMVLRRLEEAEEEAGVVGHDDDDRHHRQKKDPKKQEKQQLQSSSSLVRSARAVFLARAALADAQVFCNDASHEGEQRRLQQRQWKKTLRSIEERIRRSHVDATYATRLAMEESIVFASNSITVIPNSDSMISGSGSSSSGGVCVGGVNVGGSSESRNSRLAGAYDALLALYGDEHDANSTNDDLDSLMYDLSSNIYKLVLQPLMLQQQVRTKKKRFTQVSATVKRGSGHPTLEWSTEDASGLSSGDDGVVVGVREKEQDLSMIGEEKNETDGGFVPSKNHPWTRAILGVTTVLRFVHKHILLGRTDLARRFGRHLFGYPFLCDDDEDDNKEEWRKYYPERKSTESASAGANWGSVVESADAHEEGRGPLMEDLLELLWDCIPSTLSELDDVAFTLQSVTKEFEHDVLCEMGFYLVILPKEQPSSSFCDDKKYAYPLSDVTSDLFVRYAEKRRMSILARGRSVLMEDYHNTVVVGTPVPLSTSETTAAGTVGGGGSGVVIRGIPQVYENINDSPAMAIFKLPKMAISTVTKGLLDMCRDTMDEATAHDAISLSSSSSSSDQEIPTGGGAVVSPMLYRTARELLDLYRALLPAVHGNDLSTVPRCAAVFHNDCVYLAHHLATLGFFYRDKFRSSPSFPLAKMCTFVDMVPAFRELSDRYLGEMVEKHKLEMVDIVQERVVMELRNSLRMNEGDASWGNAEAAIRAAQYHLKQLSVAWEPPILSQDVYCRVMGNLVDTLFTLILDPVIQAEDISEAASHFVSSLFNQVIQTSSELFVAIRTGGSNDATFGSGGAIGGAGSAVCVASSSCRLWDRLTAICRFMDMSLSDVSEALAKGVFRSVTGPELTKLICATFDESDKRERLLLALSD